LVRYVIANDLSPGAVEAMKRNIAINGFEEYDPASTSSKNGNAKQMVHINEGDAWYLFHFPPSLKLLLTTV